MTCKSILAGGMLCIMCIDVLYIYAYVTLINKAIYINFFLKNIYKFY